MNLPPLVGFVFACALFYGAIVYGREIHDVLMRSRGPYGYQPDWGWYLMSSLIVICLAGLGMYLAAEAMTTILFGAPAPLE